MLILQDATLRRSVFKTALPAMGEMTLYMLIGIVDIAIVGRLGAVPLAAVSLGAEIFFSTILLLEALATGSTILVAQAKGAQDLYQLHQVSIQTVFISLVMGFLIFFLGLHYTTDIVNLFAVEEEVMRQSVGYLKIVFLISPVALTYCMIVSLFRGMGRTDIPMKIAIVINLINSFGDYVLVFGKFGFPALGVLGAAWATSIAHIVGFLISFIWLIFGPELKGITIKIRPQLHTIKNIFRLGLPSMGEQFLMAGSGLVSTFLIVYLGTVSYASHQVALMVESLSYMPGFGIAIAATALVGHAVGANDWQQARKVTKGSIELAIVLMGSIGILFALFPYQIARLFTTDKEIIQTAGLLLRIASLEQVTIAISMVLGGVLKGTGDTRTPMLINLLFVVLFRIPLLYLFIRIWHLPIAYIWIIFVVDWLMRASLYIAAYYRNPIHDILKK
ncbi:MAG: MATE family efflux transporter [Bacillota bacterium]|nr:MATE family efflux transporter [Bacillota bacterium]